MPERPLGDVSCDAAPSSPPCAPDIYEHDVVILAFCGPRPNLIEDWGVAQEHIKHAPLRR